VPQGEAPAAFNVLWILVTVEKPEFERTTKK